MPRHLPTVRYAAKRLYFKRSVIEQLGPDESFAVDIRPAPGEPCTVSMTRAEFEQVFANVLSTRAWADGNYNYPKLPKRALPFVVQEAGRLPEIEPSIPALRDGTQPDDNALPVADLSQLVVRAWMHYAANLTEPYLVQPSAPVLFFGDLNSYQQSPVRVITAGLNPSKREFPDDDRFKRFRMVQDVYPAVLDGDRHDVYLQALSAYFENQPLRDWFDSYEPLLRTLDASFYPGRPCTALHTDICSPLATDPTWTKLARKPQETLIGAGRKLWRDLIAYLEPDVILISVARAHIEVFPLQAVAAPREIYTVPHKQPYVVLITPVRLPSGKESLVVFGRAAQKPFGLLSNVRKADLGQTVLRELRRG